MFIDFRSHFGCQHALPKGESPRHFFDIFARCLQDAPTCAQERPKSAPRGPKSAPRAAKSDPRVPQDTSRALQKPPKITQPYSKERKSRKSYRKGTITGNNAENQTKNLFLIKRFIVRGEFSSADSPLRVG